MQTNPSLPSPDELHPSFPGLLDHRDPAPAGPPLLLQVLLRTWEYSGNFSSLSISMAQFGLSGFSFPTSEPFPAHLDHIQVFPFTTKFCPDLEFPEKSIDPDVHLPVIGKET